MTIHAAVVGQGGTVYVGDRRLTRTDTCSVFDEEAVKALVIRTSNALAVLAYTGLAFVEGRPTDVWIAEALTGSPFRLIPGEREGVVQIDSALVESRRLQGHGIDDVLVRLVHQLNALFARIPDGRRQRRAFEIQVVGTRVQTYAHSIARLFPLHLRVRWSERRQRFVVDAHTRRALARKHVLAVWPDWSTAEERRVLLDRLLRCPSVRDARSELLHFVRSRSSTLIGDDAVSVVIPNISSVIISSHRLLENTNRLYGAAEILTPWFITPELTHLPAAMGGFSTSFSVIDTRVHFLHEDAAITPEMFAKAPLSRARLSGLRLANPSSRIDDIARMTSSFTVNGQSVTPITIQRRRQWRM